MTQSLASAIHPSRSDRRRAAFADIRARVQFAVTEEVEPKGIWLRNAARRGLRRKQWIALGCVVATAACGLVAWAESIDRAAADAPPAAARPVPMPVPEWVDINRPFPLYDVSGGDFAKLPLHYGARRDTSGSARQDILAYGPPQAGDPFLRMMFDRRTAEPREATSLYVDLARLAGDVGLAVVRAGRATSLDTRFGSFEISGVSLSQAGRSADCVGFRRAASVSSSKLQIAGIACGGADRAFDPATLACTLNRVDLVSAGDDIDLQALFAEAERRRGTNCEPVRKGGLALKLPASAIRKTIGALKGSIGPATDRTEAMPKNVAHD